MDSLTQVNFIITISKFQIEYYLKIDYVQHRSEIVNLCCDGFNHNLYC